MDAELESICLEMISQGGEARSMIFEALAKACDGDITGAREMLMKSREPMTIAHKCQMRLLQKESSGNLVGNSVLLVHAQDILMASITERDLADFMITLFERIQTLERKQYKTDV
jgi:PTS system cellobiose-specific IIA component